VKLALLHRDGVHLQICTKRSYVERSTAFSSMLRTVCRLEQAC